MGKLPGSEFLSRTFCTSHTFRLHSSSVVSVTGSHCLHHQQLPPVFVTVLSDNIPVVVVVCFMNTCWAPHHEMSPKHFTVVTIALFSASEQTQCALVVCHLKSVTHLTQHILNIHRSGDNAVWLLHGQCYVKLLLSQCIFCGHHTTKHRFTVSPLKLHA